MVEDLVFDFQAAVERVDQDKELLLELCQMFFEQQESSLNGLESALSSGDTGSAREIAHSMKSALGNLGAMRAFRIAQRIELSCKEGDLSAARAAHDGFGPALTEFRNAIDATLNRSAG